MKSLLFLIGLLAISGVVLFSTNQPEALQSVNETQILKAFQQWKSEFGQNFNGPEEEYRYAEFKNNYLFIEKHNALGESLQLKLTQFAAMSNEEYRANYLLRTRPTADRKGQTKFQEVENMATPDSWNWNTQGAVYATQNQGSCGSCWAFATIGGLQGLRQINTGILELLSAQQVTSCTPKEFLDDKTQGCNGGEARYAYQYTAENGIETWESYPYVNFNGGVAAPCNYNKSKVVFQNKGVGYVPANNINAMQQALLQQPLTIAVDAASIYFQLYSTGVITSKNCGIELNHAILLVGYDFSDAKQPYWIVQNSWGTGWGQKGFGNVLAVDGDGICGINMQVDYPTQVKTN